MVNTQYRCHNERRRTEVRKRRDVDGLPILNGIDYLEVAPDRHTLFVTFLHPVAVLSLENLRIYRLEGTQRLEVAIESVSAFGKLLTVGITPPSDRAPYKLQLVEALGSEKLPAGFDSQLSQIEFPIDLPQISEFDCQAETAPIEKSLPAPVVDYLAKDYASFRQLMLDRLAVTMPLWKERSAADLGIVLVELVAYAADSLSYFQDAIATEAYLGTARKRVSVRRHARLLNYIVHDGCNARTWVTLQVKQAISIPIPNDPQTQPIRFLTRIPGLPTVLSKPNFERAIDQGAVVFEAIEAVTLHPACNTLSFYTWSDPTCVLPMGATSATLIDKNQQLLQCLHPGRVLLFEEVKGAKSGERVDADLARRHGVRLTKVDRAHDELEDLSLVTIAWAQADALPFALTLSQLVDDNPVTDLTVARGNVILTDHGYTIADSTAGESQLDWIVPQRRARLQAEPLTQQGRVRLQNPTNAVLAQTFGQNWRQRWGDRPPFDPEAAAASALKWELPEVVPAIVLTEVDPSIQKTNPWYPQRDLLNRDRTARNFVVETEDDGRAYLRFGDGQLGRAPQADASLTPTYRIGNGTAGNIGADAIAHIFLPDELLLRLVETEPSIRNPIAASGGIDPEPIEQVRLYAPQSFRTLQRAVTEADYAEIVQRFPGVSKALATRQWTGSWYTIFITVDRQSGLAVDEDFQRAIEQFLEPYRLTGQDVKIESARFVSLDLCFRVVVAPEYFQSQVKQALLEVLSDRVLSAERLGFFHPDNFTFSQPVYLSQVIAVVMQVTGVQSVSPIRFQRWGVPSRGELAAGQITFERLEIARLNSNQPGQGRLELIMEGGL